MESRLCGGWLLGKHCLPLLAATQRGRQHCPSPVLRTQGEAYDRSWPFEQSASDRRQAAPSDRDKKTERFRKGWRSGQGDALCVVQPGTLVEQWRVLQACVAADKIVIMQAANTGLTEGSTPNGSYDREVVLINTRRMDGLHLLEGALRFWRCRDRRCLRWKSCWTRWAVSRIR